MSRKLLFRKNITGYRGDKVIMVDGTSYYVAYGAYFIKDLNDKPIPFVFYEYDGRLFCCCEKAWDECTASISKSLTGVAGVNPAQSAPDILQEALATLNQRGQGYDNNRERSIAKIVTVFNALTGLELTETDGWTFMAILKLVRSRQSPEHKDSLVDLVAYCALLSECELLGKKSEEENIES